MASACVLAPKFATAIVRSKPKELSGKEYAKILAKKIAKTEETWRSKAEELEKKLLESKQQNVYLRLKNEVDINKNSALNEEAENKQRDEIDENVNCHKWKEDQVIENIQFMKTLVSLKWHNLSSSSHTRIDSNNVIKESIMRSIDAMIRSVRKLELRSTVLDAMEDGSAVLTELLKGEVFYQDLGIQDMVLKLVEELIKTIMNQKDTTSYETRDRLSKLATKIAAIPLVADLAVGKMGILIKTYSDVLLDQQKNRRLIQPDKFENICFIFRIMEVILQTSKTATLRNAKQKIHELMPENMFKLAYTFPMFVHYVWKLKAIIETHDIPQNSQEISVWRRQQTA